MASSSTQTPNFPISPIGSWLFWFLPHSVVLLMKLQAEGEGHALAPGPGSRIDSRLQGLRGGLREGALPGETYWPGPQE